jgi:signal transduction histidine kinase
MTTQGGGARGERDQTDESLRAERERVDEALGEQLAAIDEAADAVINRARDRADAIMAATRAKLDALRAHVPAAAAPALAVALERAKDDAVLSDERAAADEKLRMEREDLAAAVAREREETDKDLSTERARADVDLATRDEFLGIVSHDLRNILHTVVGFAELIGQEVLEPDHTMRIQRHAQRIQRSGARMNRLIGDLVDVASIEAGLLAVTPEPCDPAAIASEAVDTFHVQAIAAGVGLVAEAIAPSGTCALDPSRILQVLTNLISNAIKFTPRGGHVVVRVTVAPTEVRFDVEDTGKGIPKGKLEDVFERFHQVIKNDRRGMGLGLFISKCIVEGHGGRIWATSEVDKGSVFSFTVPRQTD